MNYHSTIYILLYEDGVQITVFSTFPLILFVRSNGTNSLKNIQRTMVDTTNVYFPLFIVVLIVLFYR